MHNSPTLLWLCSALGNRKQIKSRYLYFFLMKNYYSTIAMLVFSVLFFGCTQESIDEGPMEIQNEQMEPPIPKGPENVSILGSKNSSGEITGYFFVDAPSEIYAISQDFDGSVFNSSDSYDLVHLVGDQDGFGYNSASDPSCDFFNLSEPEDQIGNFDKLVLGLADEQKSWIHDFSSELCSTYEIEEVKIQIREYFHHGGATVTIDGNELNLVQNGIISRCGGRTSIQTFTFSGEEAEFAEDGVVEVSVNENGDELAIDYSLVSINYSIPQPETSEIVIDGCNTGVTDNFVNCNYMGDTISELAYESRNHGQFVKSLAHLTNMWVSEGLITNSEKDAIMSCAGGSNQP